MTSAEVILLALSFAVVLRVLYGCLFARSRRLVRQLLVAEHQRLAAIVPRTREIEAQLAHVAGLLDHMRAADRRASRRRDLSVR